MCSSCHYSCDGVSGCTGSSSNQCNGCNSVTHNRLRNASTNNCDCAPGFYNVVNQAICQACDVSCATCSGAGSSLCTSCPDSVISRRVNSLPTCPWYNKKFL
jgi:proprotein convertase subtilisin/kexin type 5